jgi:sigma-B regulation protein RsbU (phosphoserine phosphatase)
LLMANLQATLRGQTLVNSPVHEAISRSNKLLFESTDPEKFATLFYGVLDPVTHDMAYCNAGHEIPFVFSGEEKPSRLETGGIALGVLDVFPYSEDAVRLGAGDLLIIYSDGIPDANNQFDQPFGESRFVSLVRQFRDQPAAVIIDKIVEAVQEHESGTERLDDLTLVVVKREA